MIDLIVAADALQQLPELHVEDLNASFARTRFGDLQINLLLTSDKLFEHVLRQHSRLQTFAEREIRCATVEGLLLLKLFALPALYRQGSFERAMIYEGDIAALMQQYSPDMAALLPQLSKHVLKTDFVEISSMVGEIEGRIAKSRDRFCRWRSRVS